MARDADGIYRRKDRDGFWISWTDAQGRRRARKTDAQTLTQAKKARAAELGRVETAKALGYAPPGEEKFSDVVPAYLKYQEARLSAAGYERERGIIVKYLSPFFAGKLRGIRRVDVQRFITKRCLEVSAETVRKETNVLKHLLKLAVEWEIVPTNPAIGIKGPKAPAGRVRYLQPTELSVVLKQCPESVRAVACIAVFTGMRRSEILQLRWLDVDLANGRLMLSQTKNGDSRIVYLNQNATEVFRALMRPGQKPTARVFEGLQPPAVSMAFTRACRACDVRDFRFHDLRHTAASWLRMQGADIHTVAQVLGHKDLRMAMRYSHLSPTFMAEAVGRLDAIFEDSRYRGATGKNHLLAGKSASD